MAVIVLIDLGVYLPFILFAGPAGPHYVRQTDSLAFVEHYYRFGNAFFEPAVLDLRVAPDDGRAAAEFPGIYWTAAMLYHLVGHRYWVLRALHLLFVVVGHVALTGALGRWCGDRRWGLLLSLWAFGSGVVMFYACNFLPDAAAYGLVLLGWSFFLDGINGRRPKWPLYAAIPFTLAALLKAPLLMHVVAIGIFQAMVAWRNGRAWRDLRTLVPLLVGACLVLAWHFYAIRYDRQHGTHYFMTWAEPLWTMPEAAVQEVLGHVTQYWWTKYLYPSSWHVLFVLLAVALVPWRKEHMEMWWLALLLLAANACFILLFFAKLKDHDYYFLAVAPGLLLAATIGLMKVRSLLRGRLLDGILLLGMLVLVVLSLNYARLELVRRYASEGRYDRTGRSLVSLPAALDTLRIPVQDHILVLGDSTPMGALSILGRKGWSYPGYATAGHLSSVETLPDAQEVLCIDQPLPAYIRARPMAHGDRWSLWQLLHDDPHP